ncbi:MAG: ferritin-like domain-containing protein [Acidobacteria bacterium]|nr:ferritin-like domain-containing protein [Acidobacteriota bacterium]
MEKSSTRIIDIKELTFDSGAHLLINRALADTPIGETLGLRGRAAELAVHLRGWCRAQGHEIIWPGSTLDPVVAPTSTQRIKQQSTINRDSTTTTLDESPLVAWIVRGKAGTGRWLGAQRAGLAKANLGDAVVDLPPANWGLAARGATVEAGTPEFHFGLDTKASVWAENLPRLYAQAAAAQWDPATAINWTEAVNLSEEVETAVVQIMTYLIENETAALLVPAKFLAQIHPHFREAMQLLAIQVADEARHIEIFTRRALLRREELGLSTVSGQASLKTLVDEPDFTLASFLLAVLGEGTFLNLLWFLEQYAPDPLTRRVAQLAAQDEARHVAFGMAHLQYQIERDKRTLERLAAAINRRHDALSQTSGLNEEVFDALVILAAGEWTAEAIATGFAKVLRLQEEMDASRQTRLLRLGFAPDEAKALSALHTRNFM